MAHKRGFFFLAVESPPVEPVPRFLNQLREEWIQDSRLLPGVHVKLPRSLLLDRLGMMRLPRTWTTSPTRSGGESFASALETELTALDVIFTAAIEGGHTFKLIIGAPSARRSWYGAEQSLALRGAGQRPPAWKRWRRSVTSPREKRYSRFSAWWKCGEHVLMFVDTVRPLQKLTGARA